MIPAGDALYLLCRAERHECDCDGTYPVQCVECHAHWFTADADPDCHPPGAVVLLDGPYAHYIFHEDDCLLDAVLTAAGVLPAERELVRQSRK